MTDTADTAQVVIRPPIAWLLAVLVGLALDWLMPLPFMPAALPAGWIGGAVFAVALALLAWAIATITRAGSNVPTSKPTTTIVDTGPYRFTRNPMYVGLALLYLGLTLIANAVWPLVLLPAAVVAIQVAVIAREERYLEAKFGDAYRDYRSRVRRWI